MPGSGGAWPGDGTRGREAEPLQLCVDSAQTRGSESGAPNPSWHCSPVWFPFLRLLLGIAFCGAPHPHLAQNWVPPDSLRATLDPTLTSGSLLRALEAGCAPRVCSCLNGFEKWSLVLLVKLMSLGQRPGDRTFGPGYNLKI